MVISVRCAGPFKRKVQAIGDETKAQHSGELVGKGYVKWRG